MYVRAICVIIKYIDGTTRNFNFSNPQQANDQVSFMRQHPDVKSAVLVS